MVVEGKSLVFEYFFQIGAGLATGIGFVTLISFVLYKLISQRFENRRRSRG